MLIQGEYVGLVLCDSADYFYYLFNAHRCGGILKLNILKISLLYNLLF